MGGKKKQAQRTKSSAKPSNSGRSAELLGSEVTSFIGFASLKDSSYNTQSVLQNVAADVLDPNIDPNIQVVLKKMCKKDATTKHKALQEFIELCKTSKGEDMNPVISAWVRIYSSLVMDKENRVREAAHQAHRAFVGRVGRNLAPYLKKVAPFWLLSQYDTYPPAATAASIAFKEAFPSKKTTDVIVFCQEEILHYIADNLLNQTMKTLSKPEVTSEEDMEAKYQRVMASSLYGYALYLKMLPVEKLEEMKEQNKELVSSAKFWNFAKNKAPVIRGAWFSALISLCQNAVFLLDNVHKNAIDSVFSNLDEVDPSVLPTVWEATLHVLVAIKNYPGKVNLAKFFNILSLGGQGNASIIYPHLLPLLSSFPPSVVADKKEFYKKFFNCLLAGSKQTCVVQSLSESEAVALSYIECIKYLIKINECDKDFCLYLLNDHLLKLIVMTIDDPVYQHFITPFYHGLAQLIVFFERNATDDPYSCMTDIFWQKLPSVFKESLNATLTDRTKLIHVLSSHVQLCNALRNPSYTKKKNLKVKFSYEEVSVSQESNSKIENENLYLPQTKIVNLIEELAETYLSLAKTHESKEIKVLAIREMWKIVKVVESEKLFLCTMTSEFEFCSTVSQWLKDDDVPVEPLLGLIFNALSHLKDETMKVMLLKNLTEVRLKEAIIEAVKLTRNGGETAIHHWLMSDDIRNVLCVFVNDLAYENNENSSEVLKYCFTSTKTQDFAVGNTTVSFILDKIVDIIEGEGTFNSKRISLLLDTFFRNDHVSYFKCDSNEKILKLLCALFEKLLITENHDLFVIWRTGLMKMSKIIGCDSCLFLSHTTMCAGYVVSFICNEQEKNISSLNHISKMAHYFLSSAVASSGEKEKVPVVHTLSSIFLSSVLNNAVDNWQENIESICISAEQICGHILYDDKNSENLMVTFVGKWNPLMNVNILNYSQSILFCLKLLNLMLEWNEDREMHNNEDATLMPLITAKDINEYAVHLFKCTYTLGLFRTLKKYYSSAVQYFDSMKFIEVIEPILKEMIHFLEDSKQNEIIKEMEKNQVLSNDLWGVALRILCIDFLDMDKNDVLKCTEDHSFNSEDLTARAVMFFRLKLSSGRIYSENDISDLINIIILNKSKVSAIFDTNLENLCGGDYEISTEVARFFTAVIKHCVNLMTPPAWDFVMIAVASWIQSISKTDSFKYYKEYLGFLTAVCDLFIAFSEFVNKNKETDNIKAMYTEWNTLFAFDAHRSLAQTWNVLADKCTNNNMTPVGILHIEKLSDVMNHVMNYATFLPTPPSTSLVLSWIKHSSNFIVSSCPSVQICAHKILLHIAPLMLDLDSGIDESCSSKLSCSLIKEPFLSTQTVIKTMLQDFRLGVTCSVKPYTDSYIYTKAYMLMWLSLLQMCKLGDSQLRYMYTLWIKENDVLSCLMDNLLRLMPDSVVYVRETNVKKTQELFSNPPSLSYNGWTSEKLGHLCCWVYCSLLRILPALARQWVADADTRVTTLIDKLTSVFVSPILCYEELENIKSQEKKFNNMKIHTHAAAREVVAIYSLEDCTIELVIQLTLNHPLSPPKIDMSKALLSSSRTGRFIKSLTIFLSHQNGSIWDGLILWKTSLDKKFEGVEECYICFSILDNRDHQLPKQTCQTCRKKFHSICLYKWFTTSNKSTCPICRNFF